MGALLRCNFTCKELTYSYHLEGVPLSRVVQRL